MGLHSKDMKSTRDKANISNPKVNRGCPPLTANRISAYCVQISLGPSIQYIPLRVYHILRVSTLWITLAISTNYPRHLYELPSPFLRITLAICANYPRHPHNNALNHPRIYIESPSPIDLFFPARLLGYTSMNSKNYVSIQAATLLLTTWVAMASSCTFERTIRYKPVRVGSPGSAILTRVFTWYPRPIPHGEQAIAWAKDDPVLCQNGATRLKVDFLKTSTVCRRWGFYTYNCYNGNDAALYSKTEMPPFWRNFCHRNLSFRQLPKFQCSLLWSIFKWRFFRVSV